MDSRYKDIVGKIIKYGEKSELVKAEVLIGSQSRQIDCADEYSDIDVMLFVSDIDFFINSDEWISSLGKYYISFVEKTVSGGMERRVIFENAMDADFIFLQADNFSRINELSEIVSRSYKMLLDKDNFTDIISHVAQSDKSFSIPSESEIQNLISEFFFHVIWASKKIMRGELWAAITCVDGYMKKLLLKMIEYHSHALHGTDYDTWHNGKFIERWAEPWVVKEFQNIYARYSNKDIMKALLNTMNLFQKIAIETMDKWDYEYPVISDKYAAEWFNNIKYQSL
ncbi:aminoglycoside 6-adenylyltransferase [Clostridium intestinale]|uniref:aminoglycoside 6-adenylyltransferase n=1 Tax=Clostridium intestinale TaxID=36845 RepID=UPI002DD626F1|nr:aminoglycoside 6-adenylyltransferase [Clostridium intestinale]WRY52504.1 aminoglycoside 6-adenylyltransferase [Clostridium intestinale]